MPEKIDWKRLLSEFEAYRPDDDFGQYEAERFVRSLSDPVPGFVDVFLEIKLKAGGTRDEAMRDLYAYLLEKRYSERLNLLHFVFEIFDGTTSLPTSVIDQTPLPHEDGIPNYRNRNVPGYNLEIEINHNKSGDKQD